MEQPTVKLFLKAPIAGTVKTRLALGLGQAKTLRAYRALVERQLRQIPAHWNLTLCFAPADSLPLFHNWLGDSFRYEVQPEGGLGERLVSAVDSHFDSSEAPLFLIGSDCPWLDREHLELAEEALAKRDVTIGPALDGGYYLLGMKQPHVELFNGIHWSTERVFRQTSDQALDSGLSLACLPRLRDVDTLSDWTKASKAFPELERPYSLTRDPITTGKAIFTT